MKTKKLTIKVPTLVEKGRFKLGIYQNEVIYTNPLFGSDIKDKDLITQLKEGRISGIYFNTKTGQPYVHVHVSVKELKRLARNAERADKKFRAMDKKAKRKGRLCFFKHLTPELSFCIEETK